MIVAFRFQPAGLDGIVLVDSTRHTDQRGWFQECFKQAEFAAAGIRGPFVQENHSRSALGVVRGLHYQLPPASQGKLVRCTAGEVFDVAVDIRGESPTFAKWYGTKLAATRSNLLWIPAGFAHGFQALADGSELLYLVTAEYEPRLDRSIRVDDPAIGIRWPLPPAGLSAKDRAAPTLAKAELPVMS